MPKIKLEHVVSCSSEDPVHSASNLLNTDTSKKWKSKEKGEPAISVIFQLEKECKISGIDVGNEYAGFVEVFVGKSSCPQADFQLILAMSSLMTPMESRSLTDFNRVRLFTYKDLTGPARDEKWDRIRVVCTQPFNKHIQYGLSFVHLQTPSDAKPEAAQPTLGKFTLRPDSPDFLSPGSLFVRRTDVAGPSGVKPISLAQEIKNNLAVSAKCKPANIKASPATKAKPADTAAKDRNRTELFYESDDDVAHPKIDRVVEKAKQQEQEEEERKKAEAQVKRAKATTARTPSSSDASNGKRKNGDAKGKRKVASPGARVAPKKPKLETKPFGQLLSDVVFTISGMVNPERGSLRALGLLMGAKYKPDWDGSCTHLICAFANTPKFQQVRGTGKIVKKSWIQDCHSQRKRLPWRRYALDRTDQGKAESEDEVCERVEEEPEPEQVSSASDTDDEIANVHARQREQNNNRAKGARTSEDDAFSVDTEEEHLEKNTKEVAGSVPSLFTTEIFYIDGAVFSESEHRTLERLITAFNGAVLSRLSSAVDFIVTSKESVAAVLNGRHSTARCVSAQWIYECQEQQQHVPCEQFLCI